MTNQALHSLAPADAEPVVLFQSYCATPQRPAHLAKALTLFAQQQLVGARHVEGGTPIPFRLQWQQTPSPTDICLCTLAVQALKGTNYTFSVPGHLVVSWLQDVLDTVADDDQPEPCPDLPQRFWTMLLSA